MPFNEAAARLEAQLLTIYKFVVQFVRREDDLEKVAGWWGTMVPNATNLPNGSTSCRSPSPDCGAAFFYDRVLD